MTITANEVEQQYHSLVEGGEYSQAFALVSQHANLFPQHAQGVVYFWRMDMACRLHNKDGALELLGEAVAAGYWYSNLDKNPNFQLLQGSPEFEQLVEMCRQLRAEAIAKAKPVRKVLQPDQAAKEYPFVFALHGNSSNVDTFAIHWQEAVKHNWLVALPQSPQAFGPDLYSWNDWDWVIPTLKEQYTAISQQYQLDRQRQVLAGFSMGAGLALWLALENTIDVRGVVAVAPFLADVNQLEPLLDQGQGKNLRFYLVASQQDEYCHSVAVKLSKLFLKYDIAHKLEIYDDVGHAFPPSFEKKLPEALAFVANSAEGKQPG